MPRWWELSASPRLDEAGKFLRFETLTLAPIDLACIDQDMLTGPERDWLNAYHRRVRESVGPDVDEVTRAWLAEATRAI